MVEKRVIIRRFPYLTLLDRRTSLGKPVRVNSTEHIRVFKLRIKHLKKLSGLQYLMFIGYFFTWKTLIILIF